MGRYTVHLVGESKYQDSIGYLRVGQRVELLAEPANQFDPAAVRCADLTGDTLGYLARDDWSYRAFNEGTRMFARVKEIMGGTRGKKSRGVVLEVFTAKDAVEAEAARQARLDKRRGCLGFGA
jgi:hypothetical protein